MGLTEEPARKDAAHEEEDVSVLLLLLSSMSMSILLLLLLFSKLELSSERSWGHVYLVVLI